MCEAYYECLSVQRSCVAREISQGPKKRGAFAYISIHATQISIFCICTMADQETGYFGRFVEGDPVEVCRSGCVPRFDIGSKFDQGGG